MPTPDPKRTAAALRYDGGAPAPTVVANGRGHVADRIVEAARAASVPIREDRLLAEALAVLDLDTQVPEELFAAVAEALVWAYRLARKRPLPT